MLLLCRSKKLCAAGVEPVWKRWGSAVEVRAHRLTYGTLTLRNGLARHGYRYLESSSVDPRGRPDLPPNRDTSAFRLTDWRLFSRAAVVGVAAPSCDRGDSTLSGVFRRRPEPLGRVLFPGSCRRTGSLQPRRAASDMSRDRTSNSHNQDGQNVKAASTTSAAKAAGDLEPEGDKPNKTQQLKKVFKEYGAVGVCFHIGISLMSLGMFYLLISSGIDMAAVLGKLGFSEAIIRSKMAAGTSTFVLAYAIHKLFAPARISITLVSVPLIVRYFRKTGLFKPPTAAP